MLTTVLMLANHHEVGKTRSVTVLGSPKEDTEVILDKIYHYGQNDIQPIKDTCSVSVGDVIIYGGNYHMVMPAGFKTITEDLLQHYICLNKDDRWFFVRDL